MIALVQQIVGLAGDIWTTGNWWARRLLLALMAWPLLILAVGVLIGHPAVTATLVVFSVVPLGLLVWFSQPLIPIAATAVSSLQRLLQWAITVFALETALGAYLIVVPVGTSWTTRGLGLAAVILMTTALLFYAGGNKAPRFTKMLWAAAGIITAMIYIYWWMPDLVPASREVWLAEQAQAAGRIRRGEPLMGTPPAQMVIAKPRRILVRVEVSPDKNTPVELPPATRFICKSPGRMDYILPDGRRIRIEANQPHKDLPSPFPTHFHITGEAGVVTFYEEDD